MSKMAFVAISGLCGCGITVELLSWLLVAWQCVMTDKLPSGYVTFVYIYYKHRKNTSQSSRYAAFLSRNETAVQICNVNHPDIYYESSSYVTIQIAQTCNIFQTIQYGTRLNALKLSNHVVCAKYPVYLWFEHIRLFVASYLDDKCYISGRLL